MRARPRPDHATHAPRGRARRQRDRPRSRPLVQRGLRRYLELLAEADTCDWAASDGAAAAICQIEHRALLTGNPEPVARARMELIGLNQFFPPGQGAFGCDAEGRAALIAIARRKAGDWPRAHRRRRRHETTSPEHEPPAQRHRLRRGLDDADAVIEQMTELPARSSDSAPSFERALDLAVGVALGDVAPLVALLLAAGECELDLRAAVLEVEAHRERT